jgi:hypothetical protein
MSHAPNPAPTPATVQSERRSFLKWITYVVGAVAAVAATMSLVGAPRKQPVPIAIDYPAERSIFPPEFTSTP